VNRRIALVSRLIAAGFALAFVWLGYVAVIWAPGLDANPHNPRLIAASIWVRRGDIVTADGKLVAHSVRASGAGPAVGWKRTYPSGDAFAHIVGYWSPRYGASGLERAYNSDLVGKRGFATLSDWVSETMGTRQTGNDLVLTVDSRVQKAAIDALGSSRGACVVLDPRTGGVLAMATSPRFDPNAIDTEISTLPTGDASPLIDRAIQGLYPPGSTFKIVTGSAALADGITTIDTQWPGPAKTIIGGGRVTNYGGTGFGSLPFGDAFAQSVNTVFAEVGVKLGAARFVSAARAFGLDAAPPFPLFVRASTITDPSVMDKWELAWSAVGQPVRPHAHGGPLVTPLEMAMTGAAIADGGTIMRPYLVQQTRDYRGLLVTATGPRQWRVATDAATAAKVTQLMVRVVDSGTGTRAQIHGVKVAGKTGTAELARGEPHAWFVGFAPADAPRVVVAIVIEHGGVGGHVAAPLAKSVLEAALAATGSPK
jgi:cell division protein FtsI/penicillin-binding protein 2